MAYIDNTDWAGLLTRVRAGDSTAREFVFAELQVRLRPILQFRLRGWSSMDRDDILQNTLLVVAEKLEQPDMNPPRFALTVMRNKIGDALRAQASGRRVESMDESPDDSDRAPVPGFAAENPDPADTIDRGMLAVRIRTVITKMSKFCQAFFLAALEGREIGEVWELATATEPQLKRSAFDKRIFDCRQRLRKELEGYI